MDDSIDWNFWRHKTEVHLWQAAFLSCNIDPDSESYRDIKHYGIDNAEVNKRLRLLKDNKSLRQFFSAGTLNMGDSNLSGVRLVEFAAWCARVGFEIPPELAALAKAAPQAAPLVEAAPADDHDETLAALFDPVPVEALEKMFPADGKWKSWAEKAKANGLIIARVKTAMFNPYKAGMWFVSKGAEGWDIARLCRTLANNLPARSRDDAHLLTGGIN